MKICKLSITISAIVVELILIVIFIMGGCFFGFPWERIQGINEVKHYVKETYDLTPTDVKISFSIKGMDSALVSTKEYPFKFQVNVSRRNKKVCGDLFLEELVEYKIEESIKNNVKSLGDGDIMVVLSNRFSNKHPEITIEDIESNPNKIFEVPEVIYSCIIRNVDIGTERSFLIFKEITENFIPTSISFYYVNKNGEDSSVYIKSSDFYKIQDANDLFAIGDETQKHNGCR